MSNNEWVQEGTPRDDAEWTEETDDYGVPVEPAEWDDYSDEQAMPAPPRPVQPEPVHEEPPATEEVFAEEEPQVTDEVFAEEEPPVTQEVPAEEEPVAVEAAEEPILDDDTSADAETAVADEFHIDSDAVEDEASVFADEQPIEAADEDLTRQVEEGIAAEQEALSEEHVADEPLTDEPLADAPLADEPLADEPPADEPVVQEPSVTYDEMEETALVDQIDDGFTGARDDEQGPEAAATFAAPAAAPVAGVAAPAAVAGLYRADADETQVLDTTRRSIEDEAAEDEARAAALRAEKEERDRRLGMVQTSDANAERELRPIRRGVGPFGSFGLFVLRLITAAILGIVAYQVLYSIDTTTEFLTRQPLIPEPRLVAWILGFTLAAMAVMLVIGLGVRIVGVLLAVLAGLTLALIRWGNFSPFVEGMEGFLGDKDLLLAAIGVLFLSIGGGRFGIDGAISRSRAEAREAKRN